MKNESIIEILENMWPRNKAKGQLAQCVFADEVKNGFLGKDAVDKIFNGCWLLAPKGNDFYKFRFCFFVHPAILENDEVNKDPKEILKENYRPIFALSEFLNNSGIGVIYAMCSCDGKALPLEEIKNRNFSNINWHFLSFNEGKFVFQDPVMFFEKWEGKGRPSHGNPWDPIIKKRLTALRQEILVSLLLNELFYTGFLKSTIKKPVSDPYDVDSFLISISQKHIFPMEIKEKFAGVSNNEKFFGIDVGRIMMLLRLCLPNDSNGIYLIRELDSEGKFIKWKFITLADMLMCSSWNLQAGGLGMGGQATQTIRLPYNAFIELRGDKISEDYLRKIGDMPKDIKTIAKSFSIELNQRFY